MAASESRPPTLLRVNWRSHQATVLSIFEELYNTQSLVDVTIAAGDGQFLRTHKTILSACSPYFQDLFNVDNGDKATIVFLKDVKFFHLQAIIEFLYRGECHIPENEFPEFIQVAASLQIRGFCDSAEQSIRVTPKPNSSSVPLQSIITPAKTPRSSTSNVANSTIGYPRPLPVPPFASNVHSTPVLHTIPQPPPPKVTPPPPPPPPKVTPPPLQVQPPPPPAVHFQQPSQHYSPNKTPKKVIPSFVPANNNNAAIAGPSTNLLPPPPPPQVQPVPPPPSTQAKTPQPLAIEFETPHSASPCPSVSSIDEFELAKEVSREFPSQIVTGILSNADEIEKLVSNINLQQQGEMTLDNIVDQIWPKDGVPLFSEETLASISGYSLSQLNDINTPQGGVQPTTSFSRPITAPGISQPITPSKSNAGDGSPLKLSTPRRSRLIPIKNTAPVPSQLPSQAPPPPPPPQFPSTSAPLPPPPPPPEEKKPPQKKERKPRKKSVKRKKSPEKIVEQTKHVDKRSKWEALGRRAINPKIASTSTNNEIATTSTVNSAPTTKDEFVMSPVTITPQGGKRITPTRLPSVSPCENSNPLFLEPPIIEEEINNENNDQEEQKEEEVVIEKEKEKVEEKEVVEKEREKIKDNFSKYKSFTDDSSMIGPPHTPRYLPYLSDNSRSNLSGVSNSAGRMITFYAASPEKSGPPPTPGKMIPTSFANYHKYSDPEQNRLQVEKTPSNRGQVVVQIQPEPREREANYRFKLNGMRGERKKGLVMSSEAVINLTRPFSKPQETPKEIPMKNDFMKFFKST